MNKGYWVSREDFIKHDLIVDVDYIKGFYLSRILNIGPKAPWIHTAICASLKDGKGIYTDEDIVKTFGTSISLHTVKKCIKRFKKTEVYTLDMKNDSRRSNSYNCRYIKCNICTEPWKLPVSWRIKERIITNRMLIH